MMSNESLDRTYSHELSSFMDMGSRSNLNKRIILQIPISMNMVETVSARIPTQYIYCRFRLRYYCGRSITSTTCTSVDKSDSDSVIPSFDDVIKWH